VPVVSPGRLLYPEDRFHKVQGGHGRGLQGVFMAGRLNKKHLITIVSVTILVGTEILGAALALGWALGGAFELPDLWRLAMIGFFIACGLYMMVRFYRNAEKVEPIFDK
jgi:hypothetical protein